LANGINVFKKELKKDDKSGGQNDKETKGQMDSEPVKKAIVKKPAVKKSAARKTAVKKPAVKKSLVKKSVAKKPTAKKK
jgi:histone H1/5